MSAVERLQLAYDASGASYDPESVAEGMVAADPALAADLNLGALLNSPDGARALAVEYHKQQCKFRNLSFTGCTYRVYHERTSAGLIAALIALAAKPREAKP